MFFFFSSKYFPTFGWFDVFFLSFVRGDMHPALWGSKVGNSWRTTNDIADTWDR